MFNTLVNAESCQECSSAGVWLVLVGSMDGGGDERRKTDGV